VLRQSWPYIAAALVVAGLVAHNAAIAVLGFAIAVACPAAMLWTRYALRRVTYERIIPEDHAFTGERVAVTLRITNRKWLPLPWIEVRDHLPEVLVDAAAGDDIRQIGQTGAVGFEWRTSIGSYQRVSRTVELHCAARGIYQLGPATLRSGDAFGLFTDDRDLPRRSQVIVYPRTVALPDLALPARRPYGDQPRGLRIFEDPTRVAGIRDYRPGDSLRRIDWNATARLGKLQSRVYDPTSSQHLLLCLNTQTMIPAWSGYIADLLERSITVAASIARDAYDRRYSIGLLANNTMPELNRSWQARTDTLRELARAKGVRERTGAARGHRNEGGIRIPPGRRPEQFIRILEALAVVTPFVIEPLAAMLDREEHRLTAGTTIAVVTSIMPADLAVTLLRLHRRGHQLVVLSTSGDTWPEALGVIPARDLSGIDADFTPPMPDFQPRTSNLQATST
jgi:uncharacterized protein (DUF58 family)